jgi:hypothetical protein
MNTAGTTKGRLLIILLLVAAGCARPDWIESTLVTVDVTGAWTGSYDAGGNSWPLTLNLKQNGPRVTGYMKPGGAVEGMLNGDVLSLRNIATGGTFDVIVKGEEMSGSFYGRYGRGVFTARREK